MGTCWNPDAGSRSSRCAERLSYVVGPGCLGPRLPVDADVPDAALGQHGLTAAEAVQGRHRGSGQRLEVDGDVDLLVEAGRGAEPARRLRHHHVHAPSVELGEGAETLADPLGVGEVHPGVVVAVEDDALHVDLVVAHPHAHDRLTHGTEPSETTGPWQMAGWLPTQLEGSDVRDTVGQPEPEDPAA